MRKLRAVQGFLLFALLAVAMTMAGCSGDDGKNGANGAPGVDTGSISGTISSSTGATIVNMAAALSPDVATIAVNDDGTYSVTNVPIGVYTLTFSADNYTALSKSVSVVGGEDATVNAKLDPSTSTGSTVPVVPAISGSQLPGGDVIVTLTSTGATIDANALDVTLKAGPAGVVITKTAGPAAAVTSSVTYAVTMPAVTAFKDYYFTIVDSRRVEPANEATSALRNRDMVMGINPLDLEEAGDVILNVSLGLSDGTTSEQEVSIPVTLPFKVTTGIQNVAVGIPVLVHGMGLTTDVNGTPITNDATWDLTAPSGSAATLADANAVDVYFTPDVKGQYTLTDSANSKTLDIYAGNWGIQGGAGAIGGAGTVDANGNPDPAFCGNCHGSVPILVEIASEWTKSGHAEIFSQNLNAGGHYSKSCFTCHTVGYDPEVANNGIDDQANFDAMLAKYFPAPNGNPIANPDNWVNLVSDYPTVASFTNIQCENCHGPNNTGLHANGTLMDSERVSLSSDVCAACHGEPTHHGRFQEWQESGHGDFDLAERESGCACHSAQAALAWYDTTADVNGLDVRAPSLAVDPENPQPQTCVVCHDPHNPGDVSGAHGTGEVRFNGNTTMLPAGFAAIGVGKGAMCFTCHAGRRGYDSAGNTGLHEDGDPMFGTLSSYGTAHHGPQGSVLMGRNAYFVQGVRGAHSNITNTCVTCHMDLVPAPAEFGTAAQTNHTFEANLDICSNCHGEGFDGQGVQDSVAAEMETLSDAMVAKGLELGGVTLAAGDTAALHTGHSGNYIEVTHADASTTQVDLPAIGTAEGQVMAKAVWNLSLISNDQSLGVHNPSFVHAVLNNTTAMVNGLVAVPL